MASAGYGADACLDMGNVGIRVARNRRPDPRSFAPVSSAEI